MWLRSRKFRYRLGKIAIIVVAWSLLAVVGPLTEVLFLSNFPGVLDTPPMAGFALLPNLLTAVLAGATAAFWFGVSEEFLFRSGFERAPFGRVVLIKTAVYLAVLFALSVGASFVYNTLSTGLPPWDTVVLQEVWDRVRSGGFWSPIMQFATLLICTIVVLHVGHQLGPGMMGKLLTGRYFNPKEEFRIFLFVDIEGSTSVAEQLGHLQFFRMLNRVWADLADPIFEHHGNISSYVGDEIVVSWGSEGTEKVIPCYYAMQERLEGLHDRYVEDFGIPVRFKAGAHCGRVTVGEVGVLKRDIVHLGDVLNTTARIQSLCKKYGERLIVSGRLLELTDLPSAFESEGLGEIALRGKSTLVRLFAVRRTYTGQEWGAPKA